MIIKEDNLILGVVAKPHGTKGSVLVRLKGIKPDEIKKRDWLFVVIDGLLVPFFIEDFRYHSEDSVVIKFGQITSEKEARSISGCEVYISPAHVKRKKNEIDSQASIKGYSVKDKNLGNIGIAIEITGVSANPLLRIRQQEKEWLIPVHEDIILEINDAGREIIINAPEGLFDI